MKRSFLAAAAALLLAVVLAPGCKPKVGSKCSGTSAVCTDKANALFCAEGVYTAMACRGDKGCAQNGTVVECDESIASEQDACNAPDAIACSPDHKEALRCTNGRFVLDETCKGPTGCKLDATQRISCDNDIADVNDPCHFIGDYACTTDRSLVLKCEGNKMVPLNTCRGPKQCKIVQAAKGDRVEFLCDDSVAQEGDACDTNGEEACTMDRKGLFVCKGNKFGSQKACVGGCLYDEKADRYACEDPPASPAVEAPKPAPPRRHGRR
jgi:hypothetical protein